MLLSSHYAGNNTVKASHSWRLMICGLLLCGSWVIAGSINEAQAANRNPNEPGWIPVVIARTELQKEIDATPIELRPYRPFHFYGNTVRRMHYRGTPFPRPGEVLATPFRAMSSPRKSGATLAELTQEPRRTSRR